MKKRKRMRHIILVAIMTMLGPVLLSEDGFAGQATEPSSQLSLQAAIHTALEKNPMIAAARSRVSASAERITQATSGFYPQVYISEAYQLTNNPMWSFGMKLNQEIITQQDFDPARLNNPDDIDNFNTMLWMNWQIFDSGQTWYGRQQAQLSHQASSAGLDRTRQEIISRTVTAYTDLVFAKESIAIVDQALETAGAHLRMIEDRYKTGLTVKSDLLRARVHISELEQQQVEVNSQYLIAQAALLTAMGQEAGGGVTPATPMDREEIPEKSLQEWIDSALSGRPDLLEAKFHERTARAEVEKARTAHWPSVSLNGSYEINTEDFDDTANNYTVGANVTLNLFSGNGISARQREALYRLTEISENLRALNQKVELETRQAYYRLRSAEKRIQAAELCVEAALETLRIVENRYNNGQVSIVSLLDAELALTRAKNNLKKALKDHVQSRAQLALAVGSLDASFQ